jgi:hypothetical protein
MLGMKRSPFPLRTLLFITTLAAFSVLLFLGYLHLVAHGD